MLPMAVTYIWLYVPPLACVWALSFFLTKKFTVADSSPFKFVFYVMLYFFLTAVGGVLSQTSFNYAVLWYSGDYKYINIVSQEFTMRKTECYLNNLWTGIEYGSEVFQKVWDEQAHNLLSFLTYVL